MGRRIVYVLGMVAASAVGAGTLGACGLNGKTTEDTADVPGRITSVRLDSQSGGVTLRGAEDTKKVTVHREIEYHGDKPSRRTYRVTGGVLEIDGCGDDCNVNYTVDLPAGLPVEGGTTNGAISLSRLGPVDVHTSNGEVTGTGLTGGRVSAKTSNGAIDLTTATPADVKAETSNGAVGVTVPNGSYRVSARTDNGHKNIGIPDDPAGAHRLELSTSNGAITVKGA